VLAFVVLVCLPWLNPLASGPSPAVLPLLTSLACTGFLLLRQRISLLVWQPLVPVLSLGLAIGWRSQSIGGDVLLSWACLLLISGCIALGAHFSREPQTLRALAWAWLVAATLSSVFGLVQHFGLAHHFYPFISQSADNTAFANLRQRNQLATLTCIGLAALIWLIRSPGQVLARTTGRGSKLATCASVLIALLVAVNAMTTSRAGMSQLVVLLWLAWLWREGLPLKVRRLLLLVPPVYVLAAWLLPWIEGVTRGNAFARIAGEAGCTSRQALWANVWQLIAEKPSTGWGWRELAWAHYETHFEPRFCQIVDNAHNLPLHLAVELGLPVALAACAVLLYALWRGKPWRETDPTRQLAWSVLLCIGVHSMVEYPLWYGPFQMAAGMAAGLLWGSRSGAPDPTEKHTAQATVIRAMLGVVLLASSLLAGREYQRVSQIYLPVEERQPQYREDTLARIGSTWLFDNQLQFARLSVTPLTAANAPEMHLLAQRLLHYSPEPRVIEVLIESASLMGNLEAALAEARRYKEAFPRDYAQWQAQRAPQAPPTR